MLRPAIVGLVAGLLVAAAAFRVVSHRREAAMERKRQADVLAARAEGERAAAEAEHVRAENRKLIEKLEAAPAPTPPPPPPRREPPPLRALAVELAHLSARFKGCSWESWPREAKDLQAQIMEAMNALARELGISTDEAMRSPRGLALLLVEILAHSSPPLDSAQEAKLRALLDAERPAWDEWLAARPGLSSLEAKRRFLDVAGATRESLLAALTDDQRAVLNNYGLFDPQVQGSQTWYDGPRAEVTAKLSTAWTTTLDLDDRQAALLAPIVGDYIRDSRKLNNAIWARRRAGETLSREKDFAMRLDLMIETQKRIAESLGLNPEQAAAMKEWQFTYGVNITDE